MRFSSVTMARQAMRLCAAASLVALVATAGNSAAAEEVTQIKLAPPSLPNPASELPTLWLRMPPDEKVAFSGQINYDSPAGKNHSMLYPAPSFVGFLAAVATHGAISSAQRSREQDAMRTQADKVLVKYQPLLDEYTVAELATTSLAMMVKPGKKLISSASSQIGPHDVTIEVQPHFILTQDQRAIILENTISIVAAGNPTPFHAQIRVVSDDLGPDVFPTAWTDDGGRKLKQESGGLLATSVELALDNMQLAGKDEGPQKTLRFREGGKERLERGQLMREDCARIFFKSLRDELISAPKKNGDCATAK